MATSLNEQVHASPNGSGASALDNTIKTLPKETNCKIPFSIIEFRLRL